MDAFSGFQDNPPLNQDQPAFASAAEQPPEFQAAPAVQPAQPPPVAPTTGLIRNVPRMRAGDLQYSPAPVAAVPDADLALAAPPAPDVAAVDPFDSMRALDAPTAPVTRPTADLGNQTPDAIPGLSQPVAAKLAVPAIPGMGDADVLPEDKIQSAVPGIPGIPGLRKADVNPVGQPGVVAAVTPSAPGATKDVSPFAADEPPFKVDDQGALSFDPTRLSGGLLAANKAGLIDDETLKRVLPGATQS